METDLYKSIEKVFFAHHLIQASPEIEREPQRRKRFIMKSIIDPIDRPNTQDQIPDIVEVFYELPFDLGENLRCTPFEIPSDDAQQASNMIHTYSLGDLKCPYCNEAVKSKSEYTYVLY